MKSKIATDAHIIAITRSWADALNPQVLGSNETVMQALVTPRLTPLGPLPHVEDTISYLLSLHIAEGIARVYSATRAWHVPLHRIRAPPIVGENASCAIALCAGNRLSCRQDLK